MDKLRKTICLIAVWCTLLLIVPGTAHGQDTIPEIEYGQAISAELNPSQTEVLYRFSARQGDSIAITMEALDGDLDPFLILLDQTQQHVLAVDNDSGGNRNARLRYVISHTASYVIKATTAQGLTEARGRFALTLTLTNPTPTPSPSANAPRIAPIAPGQTLQADLSDLVGFHLYSLRARGGDAATFALEVANDLQAGLYLYNADLSERIGVAELGRNLDVVLPADGQYLLVVARAATSGAGTYRLRWLDTTDDATISLGQTVYGMITDELPTRPYSFQGQAGQIVTVRMRRLSGDLAVYVYLVATDSGAVVAEATGSDAARSTAQLTAILPADGAYAVVVSREGQAAGTTQGRYLLALAPPGGAWQDVPLPQAFAAYTPLSYGQQVTGTIDDESYVQTYRVAAEAGDVLEVTMSARGGLEPYLILQNASGDTLAQGEDRLLVRIPQTGYYALLATRTGLISGTSSGDFDLALTALDPASVAPESLPPEYTRLIAGQQQSGTIGPHFGTVFSFEGRAGIAVQIDLSAPADLKLVGILADASFQQVAVGEGSVRSVTLPHDGRYYVFVVRRNGPNDPSIGTFTLTLQGTSGVEAARTPEPLAFGQPVSGRITDDNYQVRYTVTVRAGDGLVVSMDAAPDSTLDPMLSLLDPNGMALLSNDDRATGIKNASLAYEVPRDGRYIIVATRSGEAAGTTTGEYSLRADLRRPDGANTGPAVIPIQYGSQVIGTITDQTYLYYYGFQGSQGDVITLRMGQVSSTTLDPVLYLYAYSDGPTLVASNDNARPGSFDAGIIQFALPGSGPYLIVATRAGVAEGQGVGNFILTLTLEGGAE